jgi:hypothetical protein
MNIRPIELKEIVLASVLIYRTNENRNYIPECLLKELYETKCGSLTPAEIRQIVTYIQSFNKNTDLMIKS